MVLLQRGGGGPTSSRGWRYSKETHITCDFPGGGGGGGPDVGWPDATVCLQNHGLQN